MPRAQFLTHPCLRLSFTLPLLAVTVCLLAPQAARAQWVASDASGVPLLQGNPLLNSDGSVSLASTGNRPTVTPTGLYSQLTGSWIDAYGASPVSGSLSLISIRSLATNFSYNHGSIGFFDIDTRAFRGGAPFPPNIGGRVKANTSDTLTAYFVWTGPNPVPEHADFLLQTQVNAFAAASYSLPTPGAGLSATAIATLGPDTQTASASAVGESHTAQLPGRRLIRIAPSGRIATITRSATVSTDTSNSVPGGSWQYVPQAHFYAYARVPGVTDNNCTATAIASVAGAVRYDRRDLILAANLGTSHKSPTTGLPVADTRDPDGTLNLTTVGSYDNYTTTLVSVNDNYIVVNVNNPVINTLTFTPRFSGWDYVNWTDPRSNTVSEVPNVVNPNTWSWAPNNSSDYWDTGICQMWMGTTYLDFIHYVA